MKESAFRTSVHNVLPSHIHKQPNLAGMMGTAGTPDSYYDLNRDLWIEWKCTDDDDHLPAVIPKRFMPTDKQIAWMGRRFAAGGNALCIVGIKIGTRPQGIILDTPQLWLAPCKREWYEPRLLTSRQLAAYIEGRVT